MVSMIQGTGDVLRYYASGYRLDATPDNLKWALQQNREVILQYTFGPWSYSILEFAIKCQGLEAVKTLLEQGAAFPTMLHFYIGCLEQDTTPNIALLELLLEKTADINAENVKKQTALEYALEKMGGYETPYWDVIEPLLEAGSRVKSETGFPIEALLKSQNHLERTFEKESFLLNHLIKYVGLEKKYHPESQPSLCIEDFIFYTARLRQAITEPGEISSVEYDPSTSIYPCIEAGPDFDLSSPQKKVTCAEVILNLNTYFNSFNILVKDACFKMCFDWLELNAIYAFAERQQDSEKQQLLSLLTTMGLTLEKR